MSRPKKKFYVVWKGTSPGIYTTWDECSTAVHGFSQAKYKSFPTRAAAEQAYRDGPTLHWGTKKKSVRTRRTRTDDETNSELPITESLCVDAACNMTTRVMEYQGVWCHDRSLAFHQGPFEQSTNNVGEFLAIVHGLALLQKKELDWPIYSDSMIAIGWVKRKVVNSESLSTGQTNEQVKDLVDRALCWLHEHTYVNEIKKWQTSVWGEIPADFGRK